MIVLMSIVSIFCFLPTGLISLWFAIKAQRCINSSFEHQRILLLDEDYYYKRKMAILFALISFLGFFIVAIVAFFFISLQNLELSDLKNALFWFFG